MLAGIMCALYLTLLLHLLDHSTHLTPPSIHHRSRPLIDITRDNLDEQVFEEEFSPVRRRQRKAVEVAKMFVPPEPVLSNIK